MFGFCFTTRGELLCKKVQAQGLLAFDVGHICGRTRHSGRCTTGNSKEELAEELGLEFPDNAFRYLFRNKQEFRG